MTKLLTTSDAARAAGCSRTVLKKYARDGLLHPVIDSSGRALYSLRDVKAARRIKAANVAERGRKAAAAVQAWRRSLRAA